MKVLHIGEQPFHIGRQRSDAVESATGEELDRQAMQ
jgi:hypothetical protein